MKTGIHAAALCNAFGWEPVGDVDPDLVATTAHDIYLGVGRAWSANASYRLSNNPDRVYLVYNLEGSTEFTVDGASATIDAGSLILLDGAVPTSAVARAETVRFVWHISPTFLNARRSRFQFHEPIALDNPALRALLAMSNSVLDTALPATEPARRHLSLSFEHVISGALDEAGSHVQNSSAHNDGLIITAQKAIELNFRDPAFNVNRLAKELFVTTRTVQKAFQVVGTSPRTEIERRRVREFAQLVDKDLTAAELAERSGFSSSKQMKRVIARLDRFGAR